MERFKLDANVRGAISKGGLRQFRQAGKIPAIVYGQGRDNVSVFVDAREFATLMQLPTGLNTIVDMNIDGDVNTVMVKELDRDVIISDKINHVDFMRISLTDKIEVQVPVQLSGEARGVKEGGILQQPLREITIKCLPTAIPEQLLLDVSDLEVGQNLSVSDLPVMEGIEVITDPAEIVVSIVSPAASEEAEDTTGEEAVAPDNQEETAKE